MHFYVLKPFLNEQTKKKCFETIYTVWIELLYLDDVANNNNNKMHAGWWSTTMKWNNTNEYTKI